MKILSLVLILALIISAAFANGSDDDADEVYRGEREASVTQYITVEIPLRAAVHITDTAWRLDLDDEDYIAEYCFFVPKSVAKAEEPPTNLDLILGDVTPALESAAGFGYPAIRPGAIAANLITDADKGYLVCRNTKEVQKFSNTSGDWTFSVTFHVRTEEADLVLPAIALDPIPWSFGVFGIRGFGDEGEATTATGQVLIEVTDTGPTGGWRTSEFIEGFYFDGSEVAGDYFLEVVYTMTNL